MKYLDGDIAYFLSLSPYLTLAKPKGAVSFLKRHVEAAEECQTALRQYPDVLIEPLGFQYICLRSLGALDRPFFEALLLEHSWRGGVWASWLALVEPHEEFAAALHTARGKYPHNDWIVECALATVEGRAPPLEHEAFMALAERSRLVLRGIARPAVPLRSVPTAAEISLMDLEREQIRIRYESGGAEAALRAIRGTLMGFYAQDYVRFARSLRARPGRP